LFIFLVYAVLGYLLRSLPAVHIPPQLPQLLTEIAITLTRFGRPDLALECHGSMLYELRLWMGAERAGVKGYVWKMYFENSRGKERGGGGGRLSDRNSQYIY
jgi:hypothetical protein